MVNTTFSYSLFSIDCLFSTSSSVTPISINSAHVRLWSGRRPQRTHVLHQQSYVETLRQLVTVCDWSRWRHICINLRLWCLTLWKFRLYCHTPIEYEKQLSGLKTEIQALTVDYNYRFYYFSIPMFFIHLKVNRLTINIFAPEV